MDIGTVRTGQLSGICTNSSNFRYTSKQYKRQKLGSIQISHYVVTLWNAEAVLRCC